MLTFHTVSYFFLIWEQHHQSNSAFQKDIFLNIKSINYKVNARTAIITPLPYTVWHFCFIIHTHDTRLKGIFLCYNHWVQIPSLNSHFHALKATRRYRFFTLVITWFSYTFLICTSFLWYILQNTWTLQHVHIVWHSGKSITRVCFSDCCRQQCWTCSFAYKQDLQL